MEYSVAGYMEKRRARNYARNGNSGLDSVSEPCSKKNSVTATPFISTKGKYPTRIK